MSSSWFDFANEDFLIVSVNSAIRRVYSHNDFASKHLRWSVVGAISTQQPFKQARHVPKL